MITDPSYLRLCDAILSRDCKTLLRLLHESNFHTRMIDISQLDIEDPAGCLALLACLGFIEKRP